MRKLDYQPLFGKGACAPLPKTGPERAAEIDANVRADNYATVPVPLDKGQNEGSGN